MRRAVALFLVAPFLTFASALAPQHVHETGLGHDGHDHAVAHSHFDPHHADVHHPDDPEIEQDADDHGQVVWLDSAARHESPYRPAPVPLAIPLNYDIVPAERQWSVTATDDTAPAHGPPRDAPRFRGPPPFLA